MIVYALMIIVFNINGSGGNWQVVGEYESFAECDKAGMELVPKLGKSNERVVYECEEKEKK